VTYLVSFDVRPEFESQSPSRLKHISTIARSHSPVDDGRWRRKILYICPQILTFQRSFRYRRIEQRSCNWSIHRVKVGYTASDIASDI